MDEIEGWLARKQNDKWGAYNIIAKIASTLQQVCTDRMSIVQYYHKIPIRQGDQLHTATRRMQLLMYNVECAISTKVNDTVKNHE